MFVMFANYTKETGDSSMCKLCLKSVNSLEEETSAALGWLIFPAIRESRLYNKEKNPDKKGIGERTLIIRKKDNIKIPITPSKYKTGYADDSIQPNANLPAYPFCQK